jgi:hypothetical protein
VPIAIELYQSGVYQAGEPVSVRIRAANDGYLLVLRADAQGRVRVLFPLDPTDDAFVRGGRGYDLLSRGDRPFTFMADQSGGEGTILAALSPDPLTPGHFALNGHWDYNVLTRGSEDDDEFALRALAEQMLRTRFEYDVLPYVVEGGETPLMADGSQAGGGSTTLAIGVGACWSCFGGWWGPGWGWGVGVGWGWGWSPVWAWGPAWGWGPGGGWGRPWGGGVWNPGVPGVPGGPGAPGGGDRFPGLGPGEPTPYRPRVASGEGRNASGIGVRGSLASSGTDYRAREGGNAIGVRGSLASSSTGYRGRGVATDNRGARSGGATMSGRGAGTYAGRGVRGASSGGRVTMSGRGAGTSAGRGVRSASPNGRTTMGGRGGALGPSSGGRTYTGSRGTAASPRAGGYSGSRGFSGGSRGFSGGSRGFSGGGGRSFSGGGYRGR